MTSIALRETRFSPLTQIVRRRLLPVPGEVLVHVGDWVQAHDPIARACVAGEMHVVDMARSLRVDVSSVPRHVCVQEGQAVFKEEVLAHRKRFFRRRREVTAPCTGTVQRVDDGYVFLSEFQQTLTLDAYIPGEVIDEYPHRGIAVSVPGSLVRGIWGSGGERRGILATMVSSPDELLTWERVGLRYRGTILVGGVLEDPRVLLRARQFRLCGLIVGSILPSLRAMCERLPLSVVVTEGVGRIPMAEPIFDLLRSYHGQPAVIAGSSRHTNSGPEVVVPQPGRLAPDAQALTMVRAISVGTRVRLTRTPYLGIIADVIAVPDMPLETPIGSHADGVEVRLPDGRRLFVPLVNLEPLS